MTAHRLTGFPLAVIFSSLMVGYSSDLTGLCANSPDRLMKALPLNSDAKSQSARKTIR